MASPEEAAAAVLKKVGWDGSLPVDTVHLAKRLNVRVLSDKSLAGTSNSGCSVLTDQAESVILINPSDPPQRQRYAVAHALGQAMFFKDGVQEHIESWRRQEALLDRFAATLVMPEEAVRVACAGGNDLKRLSEIFDVSEITMRIRLERLGYRLKAGS